VTFDVFRHKGGSARVVEAEHHALVQRGWDAHLLAVDAPEAETLADSRSVFSCGDDWKTGFELGAGRYQAAALSLWEKARWLNTKFDYDVIHAHHYVGAWAMIDLKNTGGVASVFTCHGIRKHHVSVYRHEDQSAWKDSNAAWKAGTEAAMTEAMHVLEVACINRADLVSCVSHHTAAELVETCPRVSPMVIENFYSVDDRIQEPVRAVEPMVGSSTIISFVGRWERTKGCDIVFDLAERLRLHPEINIIHAGDVLDAPYHGNVTHVGHLSDSELTWLYKHSSLVIMPSRYEPCGLAAIEAMCNGTPVLAHAVGGLQEVVAENETGWLLRSLNPELWAARILSLVNGSDAFPNSQKVSKTACTRFDAHEQLDKYCKLLESAISERSGA